MVNIDAHLSNIRSKKNTAGQAAGVSSRAATAVAGGRPLRVPGIGTRRDGGMTTDEDELMYSDSADYTPQIRQPLRENRFALVDLIVSFSFIIIVLC